MCIMKTKITLAILSLAAWVTLAQDSNPTPAQNPSAGAKPADYTAPNPAAPPTNAASPAPAAVDSARNLTGTNGVSTNAVSIATNAPSAPTNAAPDGASQAATQNAAATPA